MRLMRSHKYGNTCRDCALVLEKVGLFVHNNRHIYDSGIVFGDKDTMQDGSLWWEWMGGDNHGPLKDRDQILDDLLLKGKSAKQIREDFGDGALEDMNKRAGEAAKLLGEHLMKVNSNALPGQLTRIARPPTLHVQKSVYEPTRDREKIQRAVQDLENFISGSDTSEAHLDNPALRDILMDLKMTHEWNKNTQVVDAMKQFDSNLFRVEYRNSRVELRKGELFWHHPDKGPGLLMPGIYTPTALVRTRSLPGAKRVTLGSSDGVCFSSVSGTQFERTSRAMIAVATETSKVPEAVQLLTELSDAILHDSLRMKSAAFHSGVEHGRWQNQTVKDKFNLQYWELQRATKTIADLQAKCANLEEQSDSNYF